MGRIIEINKKLDELDKEMIELRKNKDKKYVQRRADELKREIELLSTELSSIDVKEDSRRTSIEEVDDNIIDDTDFLEEELNDLRDEIGWDVDDEVVWEEYVSRQ
jgi:predicted  nucleic acid-binding Zn-ribbon protein